MECNPGQLIFEGSPIVKTCTYDILINILEKDRKGLVHLRDKVLLNLDLKPQNVLVSKTHEGNFLVKIADFGTSKAMKKGGQSVTATHRGTRLYMAPEVDNAP